MTKEDWEFILNCLARVMIDTTSYIAECHKNLPDDLIEESTTLAKERCRKIIELKAKILDEIKDKEDALERE